MPLSPGAVLGTLGALGVAKTLAAGTPHAVGHARNHLSGREVEGSAFERYAAPIPGLNPAAAGALAAAGGAAGDVAAHRLFGRTAFGRLHPGPLTRPQIAGTALMAGAGMAAFQKWAQARRERRIAKGKPVASGGSWHNQPRDPAGRFDAREFKRERNGQFAAGAGAAGAGLLVAKAAGEAGAERVVGAQRFLHGTAHSGAETILARGLDPAYGQTTGADLIDYLEGRPIRKHIYVSEADPFSRQLARRHAVHSESALRGVNPPGYTLSGLGIARHRGAVLGGAMPHDEFQRRFTRDPGYPAGGSWRSTQILGPEEIGTPHPSFGAIWKSRSRDIGAYARANPRRFGAGVGMLGVAAGGLALAGAGIRHATRRRDWWGNQPRDNEGQFARGGGGGGGRGGRRARKSRARQALQQLGHGLGELGAGAGQLAVAGVEELGTVAGQAASTVGNETAHVVRSALKGTTNRMSRPFLGEIVEPEPLIPIRRRGRRDANWQESEHPRGKAGQFARVAGGAAAVGVGVTAAKELGEGGLERVVGAKRFIHRTSAEAAPSILRAGLDPSRGATDTVANYIEHFRNANGRNPGFFEAAGGYAPWKRAHGPSGTRHAYVGSDLPFRLGGATGSAAARGAELGGAMPYQQFARTFSPDPGFNFVMPNAHPVSFRTTQQVSPQFLGSGRAGARRIMGAAAPNLRSYIAEHPGRFASGIGMLGAGAAGLGLAAWGADRLLRRRKDRREHGTARNVGTPLPGFSAGRRRGVNGDAIGGVVPVSEKTRAAGDRAVARQRAMMRRIYGSGADWDLTDRPVGSPPPPPPPPMPRKSTALVPAGQGPRNLRFRGALGRAWQRMPAGSLPAAGAVALAGGLGYALGHRRSDAPVSVPLARLPVFAGVPLAVGALAAGLGLRAGRRNTYRGQGTGNAAARGARYGALAGLPAGVTSGVPWGMATGTAGGAVGRLPGNVGAAGRARLERWAGRRGLRTTTDAAEYPLVHTPQTPYLRGTPDWWRRNVTGRDIYDPAREARKATRAARFARLPESSVMIGRPGRAQALLALAGGGALLAAPLARAAGHALHRSDAWPWRRAPKGPPPRFRVPASRFAPPPAAAPRGRMIPRGAGLAGASLVSAGLIGGSLLERSLRPPEPEPEAPEYPMYTRAGALPVQLDPETLHRLQILHGTPGSAELRRYGQGLGGLG